MPDNPKVEHLEPTTISAEESETVTTTNRPISDEAKRIHGQILAQSLEGSPFDRFKDALKTVVSVPKSEIDRRLKDRKRD